MLWQCCGNATASARDGGERNDGDLDESLARMEVYDDEMLFELEDNFDERNDNNLDELHLLEHNAVCIPIFLLNKVLRLLGNSHEHHLHVRAIFRA